MKKTLKFFSLAALTIAVAAMIGCSKDEELANNDKVVTSTATLTLDNGGEAAKALTDAGVKTFAAGEQIAVVYKNTGSTMSKTVVTLTADDITNSGKTANISVTMTNPESNGTLRIIYPAAMAGTDDVDYSNLANQDGTLATLAANLDLGYYSGSLDGENLPASPALSNPLAVCEFTIKNIDGSSDLTSGITMLYIGDGAHSYYVTPSSASTIWVAMWPVASSQWLTFHATDGTNKYEKEITGKTLSAANMYHLGIKTTQLQTGALFGTFSMASGVTKHFSQGNLKRVSGTWSFHDNQYDALGSWSSTGCDLFYWETTGNYGSGENCETSSGTSSDVVNWGDNAISNGGNVANAYSTPSTDNWQYLFNSRSGYSSKYGSATVCSQHGVVILPDHWTLPTGCSFTSGMSGWSTNSYDATAWAKMEAAGAVFLPAAGRRYGTGMSVVGSYGGYWSSTANNVNSAWYVNFYEDEVNPDGHHLRYYGQSVRLVCE
jgi:hypothetical protein